MIRTLKNNRQVFFLVTSSPHVFMNLQIFRETDFVYLSTETPKETGNSKIFTMGLQTVKEDTSPQPASPKPLFTETTDEMENLENVNFVCVFCKEKQMSLELLERHTLSVHGALGTQNLKGNLEIK